MTAWCPFIYGKAGKRRKMKPYIEMSAEELSAELAELKKQYKKIQSKGIHLDMSRGKPCQEQLDLSMGMMDVLDSHSDLTCEDGTDCRNYGQLTGIKEARELIGDMMENNPKDIIIYGNSSLNVMFDVISRAMTHGILGSVPWAKLPEVKFLCPVPGYDRHFAMTEYFGIKMIPVPMTLSGPDMNIVEELVSSDESVKGIWCVPKYANPTGISYSDETVRRFARLKPATKDFRIFWDNAYGMHHLYDDHQDHLIEILAECKRAGNPDLVYKFSSTSKITFPGSGIAAVAVSPNNMEDLLSHMRIQTIGHDKVNQLRHVRFFGGIHDMVEHMRKHAEIIRPKFEAVEEILKTELGDLKIGRWTIPLGGYFILFDSLPGCAKDIVARAKKAGVIMTSAGATWPYGDDPNDSNIRIAPTYPNMEDLRDAMEIFTLCVKISSIKKILSEKENS